MWKQKMRRALQALLWASLLGWIGLLCLLLSVPYLATLLDRSDVPAKSDYIVVLGGSIGRVAAAAQFYHLGYAPRVIFSCTEDNSHVIAILGVVRHFVNTVTYCASEYGALAGGWAGGGAAPRRGDSEKRDEEERFAAPEGR